MADHASICDSFLEFERDNGLFEKTIDGVYFWALVRDRVFDNMMMERGLIEPKSHTVASSLSGKLSAFVRYTANALKNAVTPYKQADILIVNHPRKLKVDGKYVDIYSQWLVDKLKKENANYMVLDFPRNWSEHLIEKDEHTRNLENFTILKKVYFRFIAGRRTENNPMLVEIAEKFREQFENDGNMLNICYQQINIFKTEYDYYVKLLKKIKPKKIYYVVINSQRALIAAARSLGIETEEIQHGFIGRYHFCYSYPYNETVPYFPDRFCFFGKYWADITPMPLKEDKYDYYENVIRKHEPIERPDVSNNKIVVLSQSNIGTELNEFIGRVLKEERAKAYEFIMKLHPSDFHIWRELYPSLVEMEKTYDNLKVIDDFNTPLYDLLKEADTVIGVTSTAVFEALYFGCNVCIVDMPDAARVKYMLSDKIAHYLKEPSDLFKAIDTAGEYEVDVDYVFYKEKDEADSRAEEAENSVEEKTVDEEKAVTEEKADREESGEKQEKNNE